MGGPVTYDEALSYVNFAGHSFGFLFSDFSFDTNHILYSACARISTLIFGVQPWSLRLPAFVAGVLVMPLFYAFARTVFNRHIAIIALCMVAVSGPFVEYSAMARGYSFTWLFTLCSLLAARHFVKTGNAMSAGLIALACALGMMTTPDMIYPGLMCYAWAAFMVLASYKSTARVRLLKLSGSLFAAMAITLLLYSPVIAKHGFEQLVNHPSVVDDSWAHFMNTHQDRVFDLWAYFIGTSSSLIAAGALMGVIYAAYISLKFRLLAFALLVATVPVVVLQHVMAAPAVWIFSFFVVYLGAAIGLFYLLKFIHDKLAPKFTKADRTLAAGCFVLLLLGWFGVRGEGDPVERFPEARTAAEWINANVHADDRVCTAMPWDAPIAFHVICLRGSTRVMQDGPRTTGATYVIVGPGQGQTPEGVMADAGFTDAKSVKLRQVQSWKRLELFSDR